MHTIRIITLSGLMFQSLMPPQCEAKVLNTKPAKKITKLEAGKYKTAGGLVTGMDTQYTEGRHSTRASDCTSLFQPFIQRYHI